MQLLNKAEKAVEQYKLDQEKAVLRKLELHYEYALNGINERLQALQAAPETQSKVYQKQYQETLKKQVSAILENLHANEYSTIDQYMHDAYTTGFVGTMYDLHHQDVPLLIPINQAAILKTVQHDTKLTHPLYDELGIDTKRMSRFISREISRGLASGLTYDEVARNIKNVTRAPLSRAKVIARTEGHRIQQASSQDAAEAAKAKGADIVKQWDSTLDGDTRPNHRQLDGQFRELDKPFEVGTYAPMYPGDFGDAGEDCNCRCVSLKRARTALDEAELETMMERAKFFKLDKTKDFEDFKKKYLKAAEEEAKAPKFVPAKTKEEAERFAQQFADAVDYSGVSLANANTINEQLALLNSKYPIKKLDKLAVGGNGIMSANHKVLFISRNKLGKTLTNGHAEYLRVQQEARDALQTIKERFAGKKRLPADVAKTVEKLENGLRFNRWGVHEAYEEHVKWTVTHEYGHIVSDQYFGLINGDSANPNRRTNWGIRTVAERWKKIYEKAYADGDIYTVSQYGATDNKEFFAECFTAREAGEKLPDYIEEFIAEVLRNGIM